MSDGFAVPQLRSVWWIKYYIGMFNVHGSACERQMIWFWISKSPSCLFLCVVVSVAISLLSPFDLVQFETRKHVLSYWIAFFPRSNDRFFFSFFVRLVFVSTYRMRQGEREGEWKKRKEERIGGGSQLNQFDLVALSCADTNGIRK